MYGGTTIAKNSNKEKWSYSGYGIAFDWKGEWSFGNGYAGNIVSFGVDNSSSSDTDNGKNNFLVLGDGDTFGIDGRFGAPEKTFSINNLVVKQRQNFAWVYIIMGIIVICLLTEKKSLSLKLIMEMSTFQLDFV